MYSCTKFSRESFLFGFYIRMLFLVYEQYLCRITSLLYIRTCVYIFYMNRHIYYSYHNSFSYVKALSQWQKFNFLKFSLFCGNYWVNGRPWSTFLSLCLNVLHWSLEWAGKTPLSTVITGPCPAMWLAGRMLVAGGLSHFPPNSILRLGRKITLSALWKHSPLWSVSSTRCDSPLTKEIGSRTGLGPLGYLINRKFCVLSCPWPTENISLCMMEEGKWGI